MGAGRAGVRQALGLCRRAGGRCRRAGAGRSGRRSARQAGLAAAARQAGLAAAGHAERAGRAGDWRQARGQAWHGRAGARGWAHGARGARPALAWPWRWMGGRLGQLGQFWCTVHLAQFWLGFWTRFDSVFS